MADFDPSSATLIDEDPAAAQDPNLAFDPSSAVPADGNAGVASIFADRGDLERYHRARSGGATELQALSVGDNGIGAWGDRTATLTVPYVALPSDTPGAEHNRLVEVSANGRSVVAKVGDKMPKTANLQGDANIDLNPATAAALGHPGGVMPVSWRFVDQPETKFDPSSAEPVEDKRTFDPSSAELVGSDQWWWERAGRGALAGLGSALGGLAHSDIGRGLAVAGAGGEFARFGPGAPTRAEFAAGSEEASKQLTGAAQRVVSETPEGFARGAGEIAGGMVPFIAAEAAGGPALTLPMLFESGYQSHKDAAAARGQDAEGAALAGGALNVALGLPVFRIVKGVASAIVPNAAEAVQSAFAATMRKGGVPAVEKLIGALEKEGVEHVPGVTPDTAGLGVSKWTKENTQALMAALRKIDADLKAPVTASLRGVILRAAEGGAVGGAVTTGQNLLAQTYDPNRPTFANVPEAFATFGALGAVGAAGEAVGRYRSLKEGQEYLRQRFREKPVAGREVPPPGAEPQPPGAEVPPPAGGAPPVSQEQPPPPGGPDAVRQQETGPILQRQPEAIGGAGGERGGVEQGQQGPQTPIAGAQTPQPTTPPTVTPPPTAPLPAVAPEKLKDDAVIQANEEHGRAIAEQLGLIYDGVQEVKGIPGAKSYISLRDPQSDTNIAATEGTTVAELKNQVEAKRAEYAAAAADKAIPPEIHEAWSGSLIGEGRPIRKPVTLDGKLYTVTGSQAAGPQKSATLWEIVPADQYQGKIIVTINQAIKEHTNGVRPRGEHGFNYEGVKITYKGKPYVMVAERHLSYPPEKAQAAPPEPTQPTKPPEWPTEVTPEIQAAYSGDRISEGKIRKPVSIGGKLYTVGGMESMGRSGINHANLWELVPKDQYQGKIVTYNESIAAADLGQRDRGSYHGIPVKYGRKEYVIIGPERSVGKSVVSAREGLGQSQEDRLKALYQKHGTAFDDAMDQYQQEIRDNFLEEPKETVSSEAVAKEKGEILTIEQAQARHAEWTEQLRAIGLARSSENGNKIILSLFDRTGIWAAPFLAAGFDVRSIDLQIDDVDVLTINRDFLTDYDMTDVHGILCANPCTDFAVSGARWWKDKDADGRTAASIKLLEHTLAIIEWLQPDFWALENPIGRLPRITTIGRPTMQFQPHNYGDPYTKRTQLWGNFNTDLPQANVAPTEGSMAHKLRGDVPEQKEARSITPKGFALAFALANSNEGPANRVTEILAENAPAAPSAPAEPTQPPGRAEQSAMVPGMKAADFPPPLPGKPDLVLIGCGKEKGSKPADAKDLYTSNFFKLRRGYAEATGRPWMILSAKHGAVEPLRELEPYDTPFSDLTTDEQDEWTLGVFSRIVVYFGGNEEDLNGKKIEIHAGMDYVIALRDILLGAAPDLDITVPTRGLGIGQQKKFYKENTPKGPPVAPSGPPEPPTGPKPPPTGRAKPPPGQPPADEVSAARAEIDRWMGMTEGEFSQSLGDLTNMKFEDLVPGMRNNGELALAKAMGRELLDLIEKGIKPGASINYAGRPGTLIRLEPMSGQGGYAWWKAELSLDNGIQHVSATHPQLKLAFATEPTYPNLAAPVVSDDGGTVRSSPVIDLTSQAIDELGLKHHARWNMFSKSDDAAIRTKMEEIARRHPDFNQIFEVRNGRPYWRKFGYPIRGPREAGDTRARGAEETVEPPLETTPPVEKLRAKEAKKGKAETSQSPTATDPKTMRVQREYLQQAIKEAIAAADDTQNAGAPDEETQADYDAYDAILHDARKRSDASGHYGEPDPELYISQLESLFQKYGIQEEKQPGKRVNRLKVAIQDAMLSTQPHVTIDVPGDGIFRILNTKDALRAFAKLATKFPTTAFKPPSISRARMTEKPIKPLGKVKTLPDLIKALGKAASEDPQRWTLVSVYSDGENIVSTDGRRMAIVKRSSGGGTRKAPKFYDPVTGGPKDWGKDEEGKKIEEPDYPNWKQVLAHEAGEDKIAELNTEPLLKLVTQAQTVTAGDKTEVVRLYRDAKGNIGASAVNHDMGLEFRGGYDLNTAKLVGGYNPQFLIDGLNIARALGHQTVELYVAKKTPEMKSLVLKADDFTYVLMPIRVESPSALKEEPPGTSGGGDETHASPAPPVTGEELGGPVIRGRSPEIQQALHDLRAGRITRDQYNAIVQAQKPITAETTIPIPATAAEMLDRVNGVKSTSKPLVGRGRGIPAGTTVGLRTDLPWKNKTGKAAVVVHAKGSGNKPGRVLAFEGTGRILNPRFMGSEEAALKIGLGESRLPFAAVQGQWSSDQSIPADVMTWTQVGFDPTRHSYYYDKATSRPVEGGSEAIQIGNTVFVKNPIFGEAASKFYSVEPPVTGTELGGPPTAPEDDPQFTAFPVDLPEAVRFGRELLGVAIKVKQHLRALGGHAAGVFRTQGGKAEIHLRADIADLLTAGEKSRLKAEAWRYAEGVAQDPRDIERIAKEKYEVLLDEAYEEAKTRPPIQALKVVWHEIGHAVDWLPDKMITGRGNIFGHIAALKSKLGHILALDPNKPAGAKMTEPEKNKLKKEAEEQLRKEFGPIAEIVETIIVEEPELRIVGITPQDVKNLFGLDAREATPELYKWFAEQTAEVKKEIVKKAMRDQLDERLAAMGRTEQIGVRQVERTVRRKVGREPTQEEINARFRELFRAELKRRNLAQLATVKEELKSTIAWWHGTSEMPPYFSTATEMYAEAFSIFMNNPAALQKRAPTFANLIWNYMDARPEVARLYRGVQEEIRAGQVEDATEADMLASWAEADDKALERTKNQSTKYGDLLENVLYHIDRRFGPLYLAAHGAPNEPRVRHAIGNFLYRAAEHELFLTKHNQLVAQPMVEGNMIWDDLGRYLFYQRVIEERFKIFNPYGVAPDRAIKRMEKMKQSLGPVRWHILESAARMNRSLFEEHVIKAIEKARMFTPEVMAHIKANLYYATFDVQKSEDGAPDGIARMLNAMYGSNVGPHIYRQIGTVGEIKNPATAMMLKGLSLISAASRNILKREMDASLKANDPAGIMPARKRMVGDHMEFVPIENRLVGTIVYLEDGKPVANYVRRIMADTINKGNSIENRLVLFGAQATTMLKSALTQNNYGFWPVNVVRDTYAWIMQMPGATPLAWAREAKTAYAAAKASVKGKRNPAAELALARRMLIARSDPRGVWSAVDTEYELKIASFGHNPAFWKHEGDRIHTLVKLWNAYREFGQAFERMNKIAGMLYLDRNYPNMPEWKKREIVRERAGSPDFLQRGASNPYIDFFAFFYNPWKEGLRSTMKAAGENPWSFAARAAMMIIAPAVLQALAALGKLGHRIQEKYRSIPNYDLTNYIVIPLGWVDEEQKKVAYFRLPLWESARMMNGTIWQMMTGRGQGLASIYGNTVPGLNSFLTVAAMWAQYELFGHNPYDSYRGRPVLSDTQFKAGGMIAVKELLKQTWNDLGGSIVGRFQNQNLDTPPTTQLENFLNLPVVNNALGRWIKVSNRGRLEEGQEITRDMQQQRAATRDAVQEIARKILDGEALNATENVVMRDPYAIEYLVNILPGGAKGRSSLLLRELGREQTKEGQLLILQNTLGNDNEE